MSIALSLSFCSLFPPGFSLFLFIYFLCFSLSLSHFLCLLLQLSFYNSQVSGTFWGVTSRHHFARLQLQISQNPFQNTSAARHTHFNHSKKIFELDLFTWIWAKRFCHKFYVIILKTVVKRGQCDQIGRFIWLWATFQSLCQQLICPNLPHS